MTAKLNVVVRLDLDHSVAQVIAKGHITVNSVHALYVVAKRANALKQNLQVNLDVSHAWVDQDALAMLQASSREHHLPLTVDPQQAPCRISILAPRRADHAVPGLVAA